MSLELEKKSIKTYCGISPSGTRAVCDTDIIVPDYQPDVKKVLQAEVLPMVCEKTLQKGYITLSGNMDYSILYLSDEKDNPPRIKSISTRVPFTHQIEATGMSDSAFVQIVPDVIRVEVSAVNSRKINVKSVVEFDCAIMHNKEFEAVCNVTADSAMPCKNRELSSFYLSAGAHNQFEVNEALPIPSGSEMIDEILKADIKVNGKEVKSINGKLVAKGDVEIKALYLDTSGQMRTLNGEIPFTEVLDVDDVGENDICRVTYTVTDFKYSAASDSDGDITLMEISACISICTCVYSQTDEYITDDLYSPDFNISTETGKIMLCKMASSCSAKSAVKEIIELPSGAPSVSKIYDVMAKPYVESAKVVSGKVCICGSTDVYVSYISSDENAPVHIFKKEIPFEISTACNGRDDAKIDVVCTPSPVHCASLSPKDVEIRFTLDFDITVVEENEICYIGNVSVDNTSELPCNRPGIVIYFADKGESMWDIYKRYHTTAQDIAEANGTTFPDVLTEPVRIMIPKRKHC